ncbi:MAG: hypothetical protein PHE41_00210 [Eubacteriales bacterium]|nr:hypothetical protein [Eubacteriales bacterium]
MAFNQILSAVNGTLLPEQDSLGRYLYNGEYYDLPASIIKLSELEREKTILIIAIIAVSIVVVMACIYTFYILRKRKRELDNTSLQNQLLKHSAEMLPKFTDKVNTLSNKSLRLSEELFDEFQEAIDQVKTTQKQNLSVIVNDKEFQTKYPFINDFPSLTNLEKTIFVLYEQQFKTQEIALILNITDNNVRAVKAKIKNKILQTKAPDKQSYNNYKIFK